MKSFLIIELDYNTPNKTENIVVDYKQYRITIQILIHLSDFNPRDHSRIHIGDSNLAPRDNSGFHT